MEKIDELLKLSKLNDFLLNKVRDYKQTLKNLDTEKHEQWAKEIGATYDYYSILAAASENLFIDKSSRFLQVSLPVPAKEPEKPVEKEGGKPSNNVIPFPFREVSKTDD